MFPALNLLFIALRPVVESAPDLSIGFAFNYEICWLKVKSLCFSTIFLFLKNSFGLDYYPRENYGRVLFCGSVISDSKSNGSG